MNHVRRVVVATILIASGLSACHKKQPEVAPSPSNPGQPASNQPTCNAACRDSIRRADSLRAADDARRRSEADRRAAAERARATLTATVYFDDDKSDIRDDA